MVKSGQDSATIGTSGFKVPIPEIKMNRIVGERPPRKTPPASSQEVSPKPDTPSPPPSKAEEMAEPPQVPRLPFEPAESKPAAGPTKTPPPGERTQPSEPAPPVAEPELPALPPAEEVTDTQAPASTPQPEIAPEDSGSESPVPKGTPVEKAPAGEPAGPAESTEPGTAPPVSDESESTRTDREGPVKEEYSPVLPTPPAAPEDAVEALQPPKIEILKQKKPPSPPAILKAVPSKEKQQTITIDRTEANDIADPREWIELDTRREAEVVPPPEPEPVPEGQSLPDGQPVTEPVPTTPGQPETPPEQKPETAPGAQSLPATEPEPIQEPSAETAPEPMPPAETEATPMPVPGSSPFDPVPEASVPESAREVPDEKETLPDVQKIFPSPLQDDVLESAEVLKYLREASPILEELSLLMARAPSLTIADYDPSDPNAPAVPRDVHLKMDSMKRRLQILDAKAFDIMVPHEYAPFHSLIRESIAETTQACDAIVEYLDTSKADALKSVHDHLLRARELIKRTRHRSKQG